MVFSKIKLSPESGHSQIQIGRIMTLIEMTHKCCKKERERKKKKRKKKSTMFTVSSERINEKETTKMSHKRNSQNCFHRNQFECKKFTFTNKNLERKVRERESDVTIKILTIRKCERKRKISGVSEREIGTVEQ